jgi:hypothetical protein
MAQFHAKPKPKRKPKPHIIRHREPAYESMRQAALQHPALAETLVAHFGRDTEGAQTDPEAFGRFLHPEQAKASTWAEFMAWRPGQVVDTTKEKQRRVKRKQLNQRLARIERRMNGSVPLPSKKPTGGFGGKKPTGGFGMGGI